MAERVVGDAPQQPQDLAFVDHGLPAGTAKVLRSVIFFLVAARAVAFRKADNDLDTGAWIYNVTY